MVKKIIHIAKANPQLSKAGGSDNPYFFTRGWPRTFCDYTLKYCGKYEIELWRPENTLPPVNTRIVDGVKGRLFPYREFPNGIYFSGELLAELRREFMENQVIIHIHGFHDFFYYSILREFGDKPVVLRHAGTDPPVLHYDFVTRYSTLKKFIKFPYLFFKKMLEKKYVNNIDYFLTSGIGEKKYLRNIINFRGKVELFKGGTYFKNIVIGKKLDIRRKLGLPLDKRILITIGATTELKGADIALRILDTLNKEYDFKMVWIGPPDSGRKYFDELKSRGVLCTGELLGEFSSHRLGRVTPCLDYINASDLYVGFGTHSSLTDIGGLNTSMVEAMACNLPVISMKLRNFINPQEIKFVGYNPKDEKDILKGIRLFFEQGGEHYSPRDYARKYYDWPIVIGRLTSIYDELCKKYYEN